MKFQGLSNIIQTLSDNPLVSKTALQIRIDLDPAWLLIENTSDARGSLLVIRYCTQVLFGKKRRTAESLIELAKKLEAEGVEAAYIKN